MFDKKINKKIQELSQENENLKQRIDMLENTFYTEKIDKIISKISKKYSISIDFEFPYLSLCYLDIIISDMNEENEYGRIRANYFDGDKMKFYEYIKSDEFDLSVLKILERANIIKIITKEKKHG